MQKIWETYKKEIQFAVIAILLFLTFKYLLFYIGPFVVAYILYTMIKPATHILKRTLHLPPPLTGGIILFVLTLLIGGIVVYLVMTLSTQIAVSYEDILNYVALCKGKLCDCCGILEGFLGLKPNSLWGMLEQQFVLTKSNVFQQWAPKIMTKSISYIRPVVEIGAFILVMFVTVIIMLKETQQKDVKWQSIIQKICGECVAFFKAFLWAQIRIMAAIALVCFIGFCMTDLPSPVVWAPLTAFLDVLPFIGTGIVLIPLAIWHLLMEEYLYTGIILLTYVACVFTRELLEPKLISGSLGISPILTLMGLYMGIKIFGLAGIFLGPIYIMLITIVYRHFFEHIS